MCWRGVPLVMICGAALASSGCEPSGTGYLEIASARYFETHTDSPSRDLEHSVHRGTYPVEVSAYRSDGPSGGSWRPSLWITYRGIGRSESITVGDMTCRRRREIVTCVGETLYESHRRGPSRITVRLRGDRILAMEIVELAAPSVEAEAARVAPSDWPMRIATFRAEGCRWSEPLRCD